ncbi:hypothetical protein WMC41_09905 [Shinella yambaruensis]|uniref:hypothetical protein n=1 Tax=Shinella yambaruensis TaxID=415996 RepID=UPI003D78E023
MQIDDPTYVFRLEDVEVETLRRAAEDRGLPFDASRRDYTTSELSKYGMVRESYNSPELRKFGVEPNKVVTCFDECSDLARDHLLVDAPFATGIRKWQLPIDIVEWRAFMTEFPPNSFVSPHVHPENTVDEPGGSLRTVLKGAIEYAGRTFGPGDWFFIPNGIPYSFKTDAKRDTVVMYSYAFFAAGKGNRFSHPIDIAHHHKRAEENLEVA